MTQEDVIKMAREAGLVRIGDKWVEPARWGVTELVHFANLVAAVARAKENEACAKVCEAADRSTHPADLADAIRARK